MMLFGVEITPERAQTIGRVLAFSIIGSWLVNSLAIEERLNRVDDKINALSAAVINALPTTK